VAGPPLVASNKPIPAPGWILLTTITNSTFYLDKSQLCAYGDATPPGYAGNAWIMTSGGNEMFYVMETIDEITALIN